VARCLEAGLVEGDNLRWMAAEANANKASRIPREQLAEQSQCVIVGVQATAARLTQETVAAQDMIARFAEWQGRQPASVAADREGCENFVCEVSGWELGSDLITQL
jgi:hypothetical protein